MKHTDIMDYNSPLVSKNLKYFLDGYDIFFMDVWGVLHNGVTSLEIGKSLLHYIHSHKKKLILMTNSPERSESVRERLQDFDIHLLMTDTIISAGEIVHHDLKNNMYGVNPKFYIIDADQNDHYLKELNLLTVNHVEDADIILARTVSSEIPLESSYQKIISQGYEKGIPLIIANTDFSAMVGGRPHARPGMLGQYYREKQHLVTYYGKPFKEMYSQIEKQNDTNGKKILCIGDSIYTDIIGANLNGYDSLYIKSSSTDEADLNEGLLKILGLSLETIDTKMITPTSFVRQGVFEGLCSAGYIYP